MKANRIAALAGMLVWCVGAWSAQSDGVVGTLSGGTAHHALTGVAFDQADGVAVGLGGEVQITMDGGKTWSPQPPITPMGLLGVDTRDGVTVAVGQIGAAVVRSGQSAFVLKDTATSERMLAVSVNAKGEAFAVGSFGVMSVSHDRGETWNPLTVNFDAFLPGRGEGLQPHLYAVKLDDHGVVTIAGEYGLIIRSVDGGRNWKLLRVGVPGTEEGEASIFAMDILPDGSAFAVGQDGLALRTTDNGCTWQRLPTNTKSLLFGVSSNPDGRVVATGMYDLLISQDSGGTWSSLASTPQVGSSWYGAVARVDGGFVSVGKRGAIIRISP